MYCTYFEPFCIVQCHLYAQGVFLISLCSKIKRNRFFFKLSNCFEKTVLINFLFSLILLNFVIYDFFFMRSRNFLKLIMKVRVSLKFGKCSVKYYIKSLNCPFIWIMQYFSALNLDEKNLLLGFTIFLCNVVYLK